MSWSSIASAAIPALVGAGTAYYGAQANKKSAQQTADATREAAQTQARAIGQGIDASQQSNADALQYLREGRDQANTYLDPYRQAGLADYGALRQNVGTSFQASPGYEFARQEGIRGIDQAAAARGLSGSGARLRELTRYGTGVANQEYGNWMSRLQGLAGVGQTATGQAAGLATGAGQQQAGIAQQGGSALAGLLSSQGQVLGAGQLGAGQANAAGTVGQANALLGGVNQGISLYSLMNPKGFG